jgi:hypothetical protein
VDGRIVFSTVGSNRIVSIARLMSVGTDKPAGSTDGATWPNLAVIL